MLDDISKLATCNICLIASALRCCGECKFRQAWTDLDVLVLAVPPEPETIAEAESAMLIGAPVDWPWTEEDYRAELDNRRPEVGF